MKTSKGERNNKNHVYESAIESRTRKGKPSSCPLCKGNWSLSYERSLAYKSPEISAEWHPTKNGEMTPENVFNGSNKNAWWQCQVHKDHIYDMPIQRRSLRKQGCPYCAGKRKI